MSTRTAYNENHNTLIKKLARVRVYHEAVKLLGPVRGVRRALIIAGPTPDHEIRLVTKMLGAHCHAIDVDRQFVARARDCGAMASQGRIEDLQEDGNYDFVNMDSCKVVTSTTEMDMGKATERAFLLSKDVCATWFMYGRENIETVSRRSPFQLGDLSAVPEKIQKRIHYLFKFARFSIASKKHERSVLAVRPMKVWSYFNRLTPMAVVLWSRRQIDRVSYEKIDDDVRTAVLADSRPARDVALDFGVSAPVIAAWRAVRTRERR